MFVAPRYTARAPATGALVCLRPQGRAGDLFVIKKAMNLGLVCRLRRVRPAASGASAGRGLLTVAPAGPDGRLWMCSIRHTVSRARCVRLLCGYVVGGASYSFGEVQERSAQLFRLGGGEAACASVAVDTVHFLLEPGDRFAEICAREFAPRYGEVYVGHALFHVGYLFLRGFEYCLHDVMCYMFVLFGKPPPGGGGGLSILGHVGEFFEEVLRVVEQLRVAVWIGIAVVADSVDKVGLVVGEAHEDLVFLFHCQYFN